MALSVAGHFGEWLQGRMGEGGPVVLVTVACAALRVRIGTGNSVATFPEAKLRAFCAGLDVPLASLPPMSLDMPPGGGAGASTATLVALARACGFDGTPERLAEACLRVEGASDPLMFDAPDALLWASRQARVVERLDPPPACEIVGGFWGAPMRTDPEDARFAEVSDLVRAWCRAASARDLAGCARVASLSAERHAALRGGHDPLATLGPSLGALGHLRAHTGSARGLIFASGTVPDAAQAALASAGLSGVLRFSTGAVG